MRLHLSTPPRTRSLILLTLFLASCQATGIDAHLFGSRAEVEGGYGIRQDAPPKLSTLADLGLENVGGEYGGRVDIPQARAHTTLTAISREFAGTGTLTGDHTSIPTGSDVAAGFRFAQVDWQHTWNLLPSDNWYLGLGLGLGLIGTDMDIQDITPGGTGERDGDNYFIPIPTLAGRLAYRRGPLSISASLKWLDFSLPLDAVGIGTVEGEVADADFQESYTVWRKGGGGLGLHAGYRDYYGILDISENAEIGHGGIEYRAAYPYFGLSLFF